MNGKIIKHVSLVLVFLLVLQLMPLQVFAAELHGARQDEATQNQSATYGSDELYMTRESFTGADVLWEDAERREDTVKHFRMTDGSYIAVDYGYDVHYLDESGAYQEIDNRLVLRSVDDTQAASISAAVPESAEAMRAYEYAVAAGTRDVSFAAVPGSRTLISIGSGIQTLTMAPFTTSGTLVDADEAQNGTDKSQLPESEVGETVPVPVMPKPGDVELPVEPIEEEVMGRTDGLQNTEGIGNVTESDELPNIQPDAVMEPDSVPELEDFILEAPLDFSDVDTLEALSGVKALQMQTTVAEVQAQATPSVPASQLSLDEAVTPENITSAILYEDIFIGVDLEYILLGNAVKENIIVKQELNSYAFPFVLDVGPMDAELMADGSIQILDNQMPIYSIPAPYMYDDTGAQSLAVNYTLAELGEGKYILTITADKNWISAVGRVFPVTIDPQVEWADNALAAIDYNYITDASPTSAYSGDNDTIVRIGTSGGSLYRTLLKLTGNHPTLPSNSVITRAEMKLRLHSFSGTDSLMVKAQPIAPVENVLGADYSINAATWNTCPTVEQTILDYVVVTNNGALYSWDITREFISWYDDPNSNYGIMLSAYDESSVASEAQFVSGAPTNLSNPPRIVINYRSSVGLENYYSYQSIDMGRAGVGYIGDYSGALTIVKNDVSSYSTVNPVSVSHVYNSALSDGEFHDYVDNVYTGAVLGLGWQLSCMEAVYYDTDSGNSRIVYIDGDGTAHYFYWSANVNRYVDEDGLGLFIARNGNNYTMTDRYGGVKYFENCKLKYISDANGNMVSYNLSNYRVNSVTRTNVGQTAEVIATMSYDAENRLTAITDAAGNTTGFSYGTVNNEPVLTGITHADGTTVSITYHSTGKIGVVTDNETGLSMSYRFAPSGKTTMFTQYYGENEGVKYGANGSYAGVQAYRYAGADRLFAADDYVQGDNTQPADDILTFCIFDYYGRTVNSYTTDATQTRVYGAAAAQYATNATAGEMGSKNNNRLLSSTAIGVAAENLVRDGGVEHSASVGTVMSGTTWYSALGSIATDVAHTGSQSLKMTRSSSGTAEISQNLTGLDPDSYYTLSAYVNTSEMTLGGAYVTAEGASSMPINWKTDSRIDEWVKASCLFKPTENGTATISAKSIAFTGTVYFDDFQVEPVSLTEAIENDEALAMPSDINLVQNGSLTYGGENWVLSDASFVSVVDEATFGKAICLSGAPSRNLNAYQDIPINLPSTETFVFSAYSRADSVPLLEDTSRAWKIKATVYYLSEAGANDIAPEEHDISYCADIDKWQFVLLPIIPKETGRTVEKIRLELVYNANANSAYFSNISLVREASQTYKYNEEGDLVSVSTPGNANQSFGYDGADLISQVTKGNGTYNYEYDSKHNVTQIANDGVAMDIRYDGSNDYTAGVNITMGNTTSTRLSAAGTDAYILTSSTYANNGNTIASTTDARGMTMEYTHSTAISKQLGQPTAVKDATGTVRNMSYDTENGRTNSAFISNVVSVNYTYEDGRLSKMTRGGFISGNETKQEQHYNMAYDDFGNLTAMSVGTLPSGESSENESGVYTLASYIYAPKNGLLQSTSYGNGTTVAYGYDSLERLTKISYNGSNTPARRYFYNGEGAISGILDTLSGRTFSYEYDTLGRLTSALQMQGTPLLHNWYKYDSANRVAEYSYRVNPNVVDIGGTASTIFDNARSFVYTYDGDDGRLAAMTAPRGNSGETAYFSYNYDPLKRLTSRVISTTDGGSALLTRSFQYTPGTGANATTTLVSRVTNSIGTTQHSQFNYSYDELGYIERIQDAGNTNLAVYDYDPQGQLTRETLADRTYDYTYDSYGNIRSKSMTQNGVVTTHTYTYGDSQWLDLLTAYDGTPITYDASGNPLSYRGMAFTWSNGKQLTQAVAGGTTASYGYDTDGLRTTKAIGKTGHVYIWDNSRLVSEYRATARFGSGQTIIGSILGGALNLLLSSSETLEFLYDESGAPYGFIYGKKNLLLPTYEMYYYISNLQGDIIGIVDDEGNAVASYSYNAWGELIASADLDNSGIVDINPLRYRGYYYDAETGLYYLQSRYYDPATCRFINADDTDVLSVGCENVVQYNLFAYCFNNPVNLSDEDGYWPSWATKIAIGVGAVLIGAAVVAATAATGGAAAAFVGAAVAGVKAATISGIIGAAVGAGTNAVSHRVSTGSWSGADKAAIKGAVDGFARGFMTGGIMAGGSQVVSSGFKVAANLGARTGRNGGVPIGSNLRVLSPNHRNFYESGGTLLKIGSKANNIRFDVGANSFLHMNVQFTRNLHVPIGIIGSGIYGGLHR